MSLQKLIEEREKQFDEQFLCDGELLVPEGVDDANDIKQFHSETINMILEGVVEMCIEIKWEDNQFNQKSEAKKGYNAALEDVKFQLQTLKK